MSDTAPELDELIRVAIDSRLLDVNVCLPAIVRAYDSATETCTAEVVTKRALDTDEGEVVHEQIAPIQNVPVCFTGGGAFNVKFDLVVGDTVLLVFSQWSFARWRESGLVSEPGDLRQHGPSYPIAIPWWRPKGKAGADSGTSMGVPAGLRLHFGASAVGVGGQADFVAMAAKVEARLGALEDAVNMHTHPAPGGATSPTVDGQITPGPGVASSNLKAD